jgi:hypothetical protein
VACADKPWLYGVRGLQPPGGQTIYDGIAVGPPSLARSMNAKLMIRALLLVLVVVFVVLLVCISLATGGLMT